MVGDGTWLAFGEVVALYRAADYPDSESTIRLEIDAAIEAGELDAYRTVGKARRVRAQDVRAFLTVKNMSPGEERDRKLAEARNR